LFNLTSAWDRPARTGTRPTRHILRTRIEPQQSIAIAQGVPVRMAIALDVSGSMVGPKFVQAKEACRRVVRMLRPEDRLWLCGFASDLFPVLDGQSGGPKGVEAVTAALNRLRPNGVTRTELGLEWMLQALAESGNDARMAVMITDGDATDARGKQLADTEALATIADRMARAGITLSSVGLGNAESFNTAFLLGIADRGKGTFIYADTPESLSGALVSKLSDAQMVGAIAASIDVNLAPGVVVNGVCRLKPDYVPLEGVSEDSAYHVELGSLRSNVATDILFDLEVPVPAGPAETIDVAQLRLNTGAKTAISTVSIKCTTSYTVAQGRDADVDKDRLRWEVNLLTTELGATRDPKKTASLLENIQRSASKAGDTVVATEAAAQIVDLRKTGKLIPHRTTGLLTAARTSGGPS